MKIQGFSFDLKPVIGAFPVLIALGIVSMSFLKTFRLWELAVAIKMMPSPRKPLWHWLMQNMNKFSLSVHKKTTLELIFPSIVALLLSMLWVAIASLNVAKWNQVDTTQSIGMLILAWVGLIVHFWYRHRVIREISLLGHAL